MGSLKATGEQGPPRAGGDPGAEHTSGRQGTRGRGPSTDGMQRRSPRGRGAGRGLAMPRSPGRVRIQVVTCHRDVM